MRYFEQRSYDSHSVQTVSDHSGRFLPHVVSTHENKFLPNGLKAAFHGVWGNMFPSNPMDLVGQTEADLQPVVDMKPHHASCAEAEKNNNNNSEHVEKVSFGV